MQTEWKIRWKGVFITYHSSNKEKRQFNTIKLPDLIREFSTYLPNSPPSFSTAKSNESSLEQELSFVKWLTRCGPEAIAQILKSDPQKLIWIYNRDNGDFRDNLLLEYCKQNNVNRNSFSRAIKLANLKYGWSSESAIPEAILNYDIFSLPLFIKSEIDFASIIYNNIKSEKLRKMKLDIEFLTHSSLFSAYATNYCPLSRTSNTRELIYLDTPFGVMINLDERPSAYSCFWPEDYRTIFVPQLQGINEILIGQETNHPKIKFESNRALNYFDYLKALVEIDAAISAYLGISVLVIQGADNIHWCKPDNEGKVHLLPQKAKQIYDATAHRLNFRFDKSSGNWIKEI